MAGGANGVPQLPSPPVAEGVVIRPERDADHLVIPEGGPRGILPTPGRGRVVRRAYSGVGTVHSGAGVGRGGFLRCDCARDAELGSASERIPCKDPQSHADVGSARPPAHRCGDTADPGRARPRRRSRRACRHGRGHSRVLPSLRLRAGEHARLHLPASEDPRRRFHGQAAPGLQPRPRRSGRLSGRVRRSRVLSTGRRRAAHSARRNVPCEVSERLETLGWASVQECRPST